MLQVLAVLEGAPVQVEEAVRRIVHKSHHLPAEKSGQWMTKIFGSRTPKAHDLDNATRSLASEGKTVFLARAWQNGMSHFQLHRNRDVVLDVMHPHGWLDYSADPTDAWEFCVEEFGDPKELQTVAGIAPDDKTMEFLWDDAEAKLVRENLIANNEPGFVKQLIALAQKNEIRIPESVLVKIQKANKVQAFFELLFQWQLGAIQKGFRDCRLEVDAKRMAQCFDIKGWKSTWVDSALGCFPAMLTALGIPLLEDKIDALDQGLDEEDFVDQLNVKKFFKTKDGQVETPALWDSLDRDELKQLMLQKVDRLKPVAFAEKPLSVPLESIGELFLMTWSIDDELEWLLEVAPPKDNFPMPDGSTFEWTRLHCRSRWDREIYRYRVGKRILLNTFYAPRWFFPDPKGDSEFDAVAHKYKSGYPKEFRVKFYDFLQALPDKTKLSLYTYSPFNPLPMTTTIFRGVVKDRCFEVGSRYPEMPREELIENLEFLKAGRNGNSFKRVAIEFRKQAKGTFWDPEPFAPKLLVKAGQLEVNVLPAGDLSPFRRIATAVKKHTRDLQKLGYEYCGTIVAPKLGNAKIMCFAGPADCVAHIVINWGDARPEFWTRFQSGDILTTNTSNFLDMVKSYPEKGLYYRTYYDRPLRKVLTKHREGIQRFAEHKQAHPIEHTGELEAFAENLVHFVKQHPDTRWLCD